MARSLYVSVLVLLVGGLFIFGAQLAPSAEAFRGHFTSGNPNRGPVSPPTNQGLQGQPAVGPLGDVNSFVGKVMYDAAKNTQQNLRSEMGVMQSNYQNKKNQRVIKQDLMDQNAKLKGDAQQEYNNLFGQGSKMVGKSWKRNP